MDRIRVAIYREKHFCTPGSVHSIFMRETNSNVRTPSSAADAYVKNCLAISCKVQVKYKMCVELRYAHVSFSNPM